MRGKIPGTYRLTPQQQYLLNRLPSAYQMEGYKEPPEPAEVKAARKVINQYEKAKERAVCEVRKRNEALVTKAKEAIYFDTPAEALVIVRQCEKLLKGCPV